MRASVIIPCYNAATTLPETLDSIIPQLTAEDEILIIDDGSTDKTKDVISPYLSDQIRYFWQENSGGPASPRNQGIKLSRGEYIFVFDSDDIMAPGKLSISIESLICNPQAGLLFTNFKTIDEDGKLLKTGFLDNYTLISKLKKQNNLLLHEIKSPDACIFLASENYIGTSGVVVPRKIFDIIGPFDDSLKNGDDRDMWFRITRNYPILFIDKDLHSYRIRKSGISNGNATKRAKNKIKVLKRQLEKPLNRKFYLNIKKLISINYFDIAYDSYLNKKIPESRKFATLSLVTYPSSRTTLLLIKTLIPKKLTGLIRSLKHKKMHEK